jgi:hypothetical protein
MSHRYRYTQLFGFVLIPCVLLTLGPLSPGRAADSPGVLREVWYGIGGTSVGDLTNHVRFPSQPDEEAILAQFEAPTDVAEDYGQRLQAYLTPPTTGNYTFWIASDDASTLFLSTDDSPANKRAVARPRLDQLSRMVEILRTGIQPHQSLGRSEILHRSPHERGGWRR